MGKSFRRFLENFNLGIYRPFPRSMIRYINENLDGNLVGVEIGVFEGDHAESIMKTLSMRKLYLIDPYESYSDYGIGKLSSAEKRARKMMAKYGTSVEFVRKNSLDALKEIPGDLDFVYLDGDHKYESVKPEMEEYYKKLRLGGILGGHDIQNGFCSAHDGVLKAFVEFVNEKGVKPHILVPDWWVIKK